MSRESAGARLGLSTRRTAETIQSKDEAGLKAMDQGRILPSLGGRPQGKNRAEEQTNAPRSAMRVA